MANCLFVAVDSHHLSGPNRCSHPSHCERQPEFRILLFGARYTNSRMVADCCSLSPAMGYGSYDQIAKLCSRTTKSTVCRMVQLFERTGSSTRGRRVDDDGLNVKLGRAEKRYLKTLVRMQPIIYLHELQARL